MIKEAYYKGLCKVADARTHAQALLQRLGLSAADVRTAIQNWKPATASTQLYHDQVPMQHKRWPGIYTAIQALKNNQQFFDIPNDYIQDKLQRLYNKGSMQLGTRIDLNKHTNKQALNDIIHKLPRRLFQAWGKAPRLMTALPGVTPELKLTDGRNEGKPAADIMRQIFTNPDYHVRVGKKDFPAASEVKRLTQAKRQAARVNAMNKAVKSKSKKF